MKSKLGLLVLLAGGAGVTAALATNDAGTNWPQDYERDPSKWQEVTPDKATATDERITTRPSLYPGLEWTVRLEGGKVVAKASVRGKGNLDPSPPFKPRWRADEMPPDMWTAMPVSDGWIIGFDIGEFGAGVVWYNKDGSKSYEIAQEYIQQFLVTPDGIFVQGGCDHMGISIGTLSRLEKKGRRWQLTRLLDTPAYAPIQWLGNETLVLVQGQHPVRVYLTPYPHRDWARRSLSFSDRVQVDETKYYAGGRYVFTESKVYTSWYHCVTELDLQSQKVRYLVPDSRFLDDNLRREISLDAVRD